MGFDVQSPTGVTVVSACRVGIPMLVKYITITFNQILSQFGKMATADS